MHITRRARTPRTGLRFLAVGSALILMLAACGGDDDDDDGNASATTTVPASEETSGGSSTTKASDDADTTDVAVTAAIAATALGDTLVDSRGMTLYVFGNDSTNASECNEGCSEAWPPLTATGELVLGEGLDAADFDTFAREDGTTQVSNGGLPLYTFAADAKPGDTTGQGVGGVWYAAGPDGPINADAEPSY